MELITEIDEKVNLRRVKVTGEVAFAPVMAELERLYASPDFRPDMNVLWDLREAKVSSISSSEVQRLTDLVAQHWGTGGKSRAAFVVSRDFEFGLSRMYGIFLESRMPTQVQVFRDINEALQWVTSQDCPTNQQGK
jgi:hypothetical protein